MKTFKKTWLVISSVLLMLVLSASVCPAATITKGLIGEQDIHHWDGTTADKTFTRASSTGGTLTLNSVGTEVDALISYGSGTSYTQATIESALTAIGTSDKVTLLLRPGTWAITDDLTIPSNITLKPVGALLSISTTKTLTINGPFSAGNYQVVSCVDTGKVVFGPQSVSVIDAVWFGAVGDFNAADGTGGTNDPAAIYAAINSASTNLQIVRLGVGNYKITPADAIVLEGTAEHVGSLEGVSRGKTRLYAVGFTGRDPVIDIKPGTSSDAEIGSGSVRNLSVNRYPVSSGAGVVETGTGIRLNGLDGGTVEHVAVRGFENAFWFYNKNAATFWTENNTIDDVYIANCWRHYYFSLEAGGIALTSFNGTRINHSMSDLYNGQSLIELGPYALLYNSDIKLNSWQVTGQCNLLKTGDYSQYVMSKLTLFNEVGPGSMSIPLFTLSALAAGLDVDFSFFQNAAEAYKSTVPSGMITPQSQSAKSWNVATQAPAASTDLFSTRTNGVVCGILTVQAYIVGGETATISQYSISMFGGGTTGANSIALLSTEIVGGGGATFSLVESKDAPEAGKNKLAIQNDHGSIGEYYIVTFTPLNGNPVYL